MNQPGKYLKTCARCTCTCRLLLYKRVLLFPKDQVIVTEVGSDSDIFAILEQFLQTTEIAWQVAIEAVRILCFKNGYTPMLTVSIFDIPVETSFVLSSVHLVLRTSCSLCMQQPLWSTLVLRFPLWRPFPFSYLCLVSVKL